MLTDCRIGAIVFFVSVLDRALAFYRDTPACRCRPWMATTGRSGWASWAT